MALKARRSQGSVEKRKTLNSTPHIRVGVLLDRGDDDLITAVLEIERGTGFFDRFRPKVSERRYELDKFGTFVADQIDGKRNVLDIIGLFQKRFGMSRRESELGVVAFMKLLMERRVIDVIAPGEAK